MSLLPASAKPTGRHRVSIRFAVSLLGNVFNLGMSFLTGLMIARSLGPAKFGDLNFLLATFTSAAPLLDMGSSSAFYTFLSQRRRPKKFFLFYAGWLSLQGAILVVLIIAPPEVLSQRLWLGQSHPTVMLALLASFISNQIWRTIQQIGESARETVSVQTAWMGINIVHLILICLALLTHRLSVTAVLWFIAFEYAAGILWFSWRFDWTTVLTVDEDNDYRGILRKFTVYCHPLVLASWASFIYLYSDRWLLQKFSGSVQQGFFSISQQFSTVSLLGATALVNIFWKELAQAHVDGDKARMKEMFLDTGRRLYFAAAAITCFLLPFSREMITQLLGPSYAPAWTAFAVLIFFPLHQALGQLNGSFFQATHQTRTLLAFIAGTIVFSVPLAYLVLAPATANIPGLGLHSTGLAVKMVLIQVVGINLQGFVICRRNGWKWPIAYQVLVPLALSLFSFSAFSISALMISGSTKVILIVRVAIASLIYLPMSALLIRRFPALAGLTADQLGVWYEKGRRFAADF